MRIHPNNKLIINHSNRGLSLEEDINLSNKYYLEMGIAIIYKKPTPIKVVNVSYDINKHPIIKEAYYESPSTTDYNGIYKGKYIDFEAKETSSKTSFPISNIHQHQIKHMEEVTKQGAICFLIISFCTLNKIFLVDFNLMNNYLNEKKRKSLSIEFLNEKAKEITYGYRPRLDYISIINELYFGGKNEQI